MLYAISIYYAAENFNREMRQKRSNVSFSFVLCILYVVCSFMLCLREKPVDDSDLLSRIYPDISVRIALDLGICNVTTYSTQRSYKSTGSLNVTGLISRTVKRPYDSITDT